MVKKDKVKGHHRGKVRTEDKMLPCMALPGDH